MFLLAYVEQDYQSGYYQYTEIEPIQFFSNREQAEQAESMLQACSITCQKATHIFTKQELEEI